MQPSTTHRAPRPGLCPALNQLDRFVRKKQDQPDRLVYAKPGLSDQEIQLFSCGNPPPAARQPLRDGQTAALKDFLTNTLAGQIRHLQTPQGPTALGHIQRLVTSHDKPFTVDELRRLNRRLQRCLDAPSTPGTRARGHTWSATTDKQRQGSAAQRTGPITQPMQLALTPKHQPGTNQQGSSRYSLWFNQQWEQQTTPLPGNKTTREALMALKVLLANALEHPRQPLALTALPSDLLDLAAQRGLLSNFMLVRSNLQPPLDNTNRGWINQALRRAGLEEH